MSTFRNLVLALLAAAILQMITPAVKAVGTDWNGGVGDWSQAGNWSNGVPGFGDTASVDTGTAQIGAAGATAETLFIGSTKNLTGSVEQTGGTAMFDVVNIGNVATAAGYYKMDTVGGNAVLFAEVMQVGQNSYGEVDQDISNQATIDSLYIGGPNTMGVYNLNGAKLSTTDTSIGSSSFTPGVGTLNEGIGSTFSVSQDLTLGEKAGSGSLFQNGGTNTVGGSLTVGLDTFGFYQEKSGSQHVSGDLNIAATHNSQGSYDMTGGSLQVDGNIYVGNSSAAKGPGVGTLTVDAATTGFSASNMYVSPANTVNLTGPGGAAGPRLSVDTINISNGATQGILQGSGLIEPKSNDDTLLQNAGIVRPGQTNLPGTLTLYGDYEQTATGLLGIQLGGRTAGTLYDVLQMSGAATIDGILSVKLVNNFTPALGNVFIVLTTEHGLDGTFSGLDLPKLGPGLLWEVGYNGDDVRLTVVPEPGSLVLVLAAAVPLLVARRRSRASQNA